MFQWQSNRKRNIEIGKWNSIAQIVFGLSTLFGFLTSHSLSSHFFSHWRRSKYGRRRRWDIHGTGHWSSHSWGHGVTNCQCSDCGNNIVGYPVDAKSCRNIEGEPSNHERQHLQDSICLLCLRILRLWLHELHWNVLWQDQKDRENQKRSSGFPSQWRNTVHPVIRRRLAIALWETRERNMHSIRIDLITVESSTVE